MKLNAISLDSQAIEAGPLRLSVVHMSTLILIVALASLLMSTSVFAGSGGTEFQNVYDSLKGWIGGYLGKSIALLAFLIGLFYGAIKQQFVMALGGVAVAILITVLPGVMDTMISATV